MGLISAITSRGHMWSTIKEKGAVNADVFIDFLKCLIAVAGQTIFLIVDRGPVHSAKKTQAFVETLGGKLRMFFLLPYSPDRNRDELVWKHLKADTVGRMAVTGKTDFKRKVRSWIDVLHRGGNLTALSRTGGGRERRWQRRGRGNGRAGGLPR